MPIPSIRPLHASSVSSAFWRRSRDRHVATIVFTKTASPNSLLRKGSGWKWLLRWITVIVARTYIKHERNDSLIASQIQIGLLSIRSLCCPWPSPHRWSYKLAPLRNMPSQSDGIAETPTQGDSGNKAIVIFGAFNVVLLSLKCRSAVLIFNKYWRLKKALKSYSRFYWIKENLEAQTNMALMGGLR